MSSNETIARFIRSERTLEALRHLNARKKIRITLSNGEVIEPSSGDAGVAETVNILLGEDSDLIESIQLLNEPADKPSELSYIVAHYPVVIAETLYYQIKARSDAEADAIARSMTTDGSGGGEYDLYRSVY